MGLNVATLSVDNVPASLDFSTHVCRNTQPNTFYKMPVNFVISSLPDCHVISKIIIKLTRDDHLNIFPGHWGQFSGILRVFRDWYHSYGVTSTSTRLNQGEYTAGSSDETNARYYH